MNIGDCIMFHSGKYFLKHAKIEETWIGDFSQPFATIRFFNADGTPSKSRADMVNESRFVNFGPTVEWGRKRRAKAPI